MGDCARPCRLALRSGTEGYRGGAVLSVWHAPRRGGGMGGGPIGNQQMNGQMMEPPTNGQMGNKPGKMKQ